jgi:colanic acid/amylovoran biosynthesis glycosyltransferase
MKKIAYLLHRFPRITDTFIMRELRALQKAGTDVEIISIWQPDKTEANSEVINEWFHKTRFLLPGSVLPISRVLCSTISRSPIKFFEAARLAWATSRPGLKGVIYQAFYLAEAMLAADLLRKNKIVHVHNHFGDHTGIITMLAAKLANISYSISFHGPHVFFDGQSQRIKEKVSHARFIRCISYFCRSQVILFSDAIDLSTLWVGA